MSFGTLGRNSSRRSSENSPPPTRLTRTGRRWVGAPRPTTTRKTLQITIKTEPLATTPRTELSVPLRKGRGRTEVVKKVSRSPCRGVVAPRVVGENYLSVSRSRDETIRKVLVRMRNTRRMFLFVLLWKKLRPLRSFFRANTLTFTREKVTTCTREGTVDVYRAHVASTLEFRQRRKNRAILRIRPTLLQQHWTRKKGRETKVTSRDRVTKDTYPFSMTWFVSRSASSSSLPPWASSLPSTEAEVSSGTTKSRVMITAI